MSGIGCNKSPPTPRRRPTHRTRDKRLGFWFPESPMAMLIRHSGRFDGMSSDGNPVVTPAQPWTQDGTATVAPIAPFPEPTPRTLPLDNRPASTLTVRRSVNPGGLVIIPTGHEPVVSPATLPIRSSSGDEVLITGDNYTEWPDGFVIWFLAH